MTNPGSKIEVYGANGRLDAKFLPSTCKVIREIATVAEKLEEYFPLALEGPAGSISRVSAHLNLCYHQVGLQYPIISSMQVVSCSDYSLVYTRGNISPLVMPLPAAYNAR